MIAIIGKKSVFFFFLLALLLNLKNRGTNEVTN